jgi:HK97 family phage portal protein
MFAGGTGHGADASLTPKSSAVGGLGETRGVWLMAPGAASWSGRRYDRFAEEGYRRNVIAHRCVRLVAEGAASMPWLLYEGEREVTQHPLLDLLGRPNPLEGGTGLLENLYGFLLIAGNGWLEAVENARGQVAELYALRPDRMTVVPGPRGWPRAYKYSVGGESHLFEHDPARGIAPILHLKAFHPLDDHSGLSAFEPAAYAIDLHNESAAWNKALLDNAARPSGALVYDPGEKGGTLTEAQFARLKAEMEAQFQGRENAGRPMLLEGGLSWQQLGFSPSDMDFINAKHVSAREIALAFGVPPMLLGIPGDNTYANYQEANRALWRQTMLPMATKLTAALNAWLAPRFGEGLRLAFDTDAVEALSADRAQTWTQVGAASFLTVNEKRSALGYGPIEGGDVLQPVTPFMTKGVRIKSVVEDRDQRFWTLFQEYVKAEIEGKKYKIWRTAKDGDVRDTHRQVDGICIPINEKFRVGGESLFLPCDALASLDETANCRCTVEYVDELPPEAQQRLTARQTIAADIDKTQRQMDIYHREMLSQAAIIEEEVGRLQHELTADESDSLIDALLGAVGVLMEAKPFGAFVSAATTVVSRAKDLVAQGRKIEESHKAIVTPAAYMIDSLIGKMEALGQDILNLRRQQEQLGCQGR